MAQSLEGRDGPLSPQMIRCLSLLADGRSLAQIGAALAVSESAATDLAEAARLVLSARNRVHAVNIAIRKGLI